MYRKVTVGLIPEIPGNAWLEKAFSLNDRLPNAMALPPPVELVGAALSETTMRVISEPPATPVEPFPINVVNVALYGKL